jgi:hypothetical protein
MLGASHANRDWKTNLDSHTAPYRSGNLGWSAEKMRATRDIGERFVDGDSFDERREIIEHVDGRIAKPRITYPTTLALPPTTDRLRRWREGRILSNKKLEASKPASPQ